MANVVEAVVQQGLCSGCGVCAGVCPHGVLRMAPSVAGDLKPRATGDCQSDCGLCLAVCPFGIPGVSSRRLSESLFHAYGGSSPQLDAFVGWYRCCYCGYSAEDAHRRNGASGGLVTWTLEKLLSHGLVDRAAVVARSHESLRLFGFRVATTSDDVRSAAGSFYYPVAVSRVLEQVRSSGPLLWAIVGLPCLIHGVRLAMARIPELHRRIRFLLGLTCGMLPNDYYTEFLIACSGVGRPDVTELGYRGKRVAGPANAFEFWAKAKDGGEGRRLPYTGVPYYLCREGFFRVNACNFCEDVFAECADASYMDAWLPEYKHEPRGTSLVVARSLELHGLLEEARVSHEIETEPLDVSRVVESQRGQIRRKQEMIAGRLAWAAARGIRVPVTRAIPQRSGATDRACWWLEHSVQEHSKVAWARFGRRHGVWALWLAMSPWVLLIEVLGLARKLRAMPGRLWRGLARLVSAMEY